MTHQSNPILSSPCDCLHNIHMCCCLLLTSNPLFCSYYTGTCHFFSFRACSNLHCISCDFAVYKFDNFQWLSDTDYLFLRTNMPEFERVKDHLLPSEGCRAYACQCRHYSTSTMKQVKGMSTLLWVCKGHSSHSTVSS